MVELGIGIRQLHDALQRRELTATDLAEDSIARIREWDTLKQALWCLSRQHFRALTRIVFF